ncbi:hypothetical protein [Fodinicola feengrottensis]|uniref:hypothetical protein n=1 Tax=Fodinicola feengrottensis TaxID=435914 RepID=UPI0024413F60|nr:hypothetical protein [Fodinicola feengrottensis]
MPVPETSSSSTRSTTASNGVSCWPVATSQTSQPAPIATTISGSFRIEPGSALRHMNWRTTR